VIETAKEERHGEMVLGGKRLGGDLADGYFVEPTIFADVDNSTKLAQDEIFGPVLSIIRFEDADDAIRIANGTPFGLAAVVHTHNLERAHRLADELEAGIVFVNSFASAEGMPISVPFGGVKRSGFGRLGGMAAIREFSQTKNIAINISGQEAKSVKAPTV
jgi:acyl-CoA reductase-like NAD-dependent aldehyde dehydrogenase